MPSNASPNSLQIGPGRLPANVVAASSFQSVGGSGAESSDSAPAIVSVVRTTTLTRLSSEMYVLIDNRTRINAVAGSQLADGETFTINDNVNPPTVFEFDSNGSVSGGNVAVPFSPSLTGPQVAAAIDAAISSVGGSLDVSASTLGEIVLLESQTTFAPPILVTDTVADPEFSFFGFDAANYTVTFPSAAEVGDVIHLVASSTEEHNRNVVRINGGPPGIHGGIFTEEVFGGAYSGRSYVLGPECWVALTSATTMRWVTSATTLLRTSKDQIVLADPTAGSFQIVLPTRPLIGDRITVVKAVASANAVTVVGGSAFDTFDSAVTNAGSSLVTNFGSMTFVRVSQLKWVTLPGSPEVLVVTDTIDLRNVSSARHIHVLVATNNAAWIAGTKSVVFPTASQTRPGSIVTVTDIDGGAASNPIVIGNNGPPPSSGVIGVSGPSGSFAYVLNTNHGSTSFINVAGSTYRVHTEAFGVVGNFSGLVRADSRSDSAGVSRLKPGPLFNWSERRVALHAEFAGLITNFYPVDGFTAGGSMLLSARPGTTGTVGVLRCTVPLGQSGYIHLGSLPTSALFDPAQLMGFRAILTPISPNPGLIYRVALGFGDDISSDTSADHSLGNNGLYVWANQSQNWRHTRQSGGVSSGTSMTTATQNARFVIEYYASSTGWDAYINGVRSTGTLANVPTAMLNFGMLIVDLGGGGVDHRVDIDSLTVFTADMGSTRHNP